MAMRNEEAEELLKELAKAGMLDQRAITRIRYQDLQLGKRDGKELGVQDVINRVDTGKLRRSDYEVFSNIAEDSGATVDDYSPAFSTRLSDMFSGDSSFADTTGGVWAGEEGEPTLPEAIKEQKAGREEMAQMRKDFVRALDDVGYDIDITHLGSSHTPDDLVDRLVREYDIPPEIIDGISDEVEVMAMERGLSDQELADRQEENETIDRTNEENPTYAKNLAAFQILDNASPTKYKFDRETGAIYATETGLQVDRQGNDVGSTDITGEKGADLVGGWPEGFIPQWEPDPYGTGWGKMSQETGMQVSEADYMDVLDVVNNKEWYGADAARYVSGQAFLGGFDDGYRVKVEENDIMRRSRATIETLGTEYQGRQALGNYVWDAMNQDTQDTRRPWYDEGDNWAQFAGLSAENIAAVQSRMIAVGALDPDEVVHGVWGPTEATQMNKWMTIANGKALQWTDLDEDMLKEYFEEEKAQRTPRAAFVPQAFRPMDPATVEVTVRDSVRALIGRDPTEEDLQQLGGYLTDQYSSSYQADVAAGRSQYNAQLSADESGAQFAQPGAVQDVDFESRYILEMEKRFEPQVESQERGDFASKQQDMGMQMSNLMNRLGGGVG